MADNATEFKVHLVVKFIILSLFVTKTSLYLSYKYIVAKFKGVFLRCKTLIPRTNCNVISTTTNLICSKIFYLN